jgi:hypothetical protein
LTKWLLLVLLILQSKRKRLIEKGVVEGKRLSGSAFVVPQFYRDTVGTAGPPIYAIRTSVPDATKLKTNTGVQSLTNVVLLMVAGYGL